MQERLSSPLSNGAERWAIVLLSVVAMVTLAPMLVRVPLWIERPNEGWNAIHALNAFTHALYPQQGAWVVNNYPPLSFYLIGGLAKLTGDPVLPGRIVSLLSFAAVAGAIALILRQLGTSRLAATLGALTFVATIGGLFSLYVGLSDPQMLAHALVSVSISILIGARRRSVVAMAAIGTVAGLFVKQIVIGLPLGATLWLAWHRREWLATWIGTGIAASAAALGLFVAVYGEAFIFNVTFPRVLSWARLRSSVGYITRPAIGILAFALVALRRDAWRDTWRDPAIGFAGFALAGGLIEILLFGSALGVGINVAFDLVIASAIATGLAFDRLAALTHGARWRVLLVLALSLRILAGAPAPLNPFAVRAFYLPQQAETMAAIDLLKTVEGPIICEPLVTCALAGHASVADLWKLRFENTIGPFVDKGALLTAIRERRFAAVVTGANLFTPADDRFLPGLHDTVKSAYGPPLTLGAFYIFLRNPR